MWQRLGVHPSHEAELGWAAGRFGVIAAALIGLVLFVGDSPVFPFVMGILLFASIYATVLLWLLTQRRTRIVFGVGLALDNGALFISWWVVAAGFAGEMQTNDLWLALIPMIITGVLRLGWVVGSIYTAGWLAWMAWSHIHYYPADSYDVEQLPVRLAFVVVIAGLVMRVASLLNRQRDREMERMRELENLESLKSTLLKTVAHEVKSPITAVRAAADILTDEHLDVDAEQRRRVVSALTGGLNRLERIVQESLAYAELKASGLDLVFDDLDLREVVAEVIGVVQPVADRKHQVVAFTPPTQAITVRADHARIVQMLVNLLSNASERAPNGSRIDLTIRDDDDWVITDVINPGPPIPEAERRLIFEEYYRGSEPDRRAGGAAVLGLATAKRLAQAHAGDIYVRSTSDDSTTFSALLPSSKALLSGTAPVLD